MNLSLFFLLNGLSPQLRASAPGLERPTGCGPAHGAAGQRMVRFNRRGPRTCGMAGRRPASRNTKGICLVECLIYVSLWLVITGLAFGAYFQCLTTSTLLRRQARDLVQMLQLGERWRADIRAATEPPRLTNQQEGYKLSLIQGTNEVVYQFARGQLWRQVLGQAPTQLLLTNVLSSHIVSDQRTRVTAWRWEIELQGRRSPERRTPPKLSFLAVNQMPSQP